MNRRMTMLLGVLAAMLAVVAGYSVLELLAARNAALACERDVADCRTLIRQIDAHRRRPSVAAEREKEPDEISGPIERAARAAGIASERLVRIVPEPGRRLASTPYVEKPVQVTLKNVPIRQIVGLLDAVTTAQAGLEARSIRLTAPQPEDAGDSWNVELTLGYLVFEPIRDQR